VYNFQADLYGKSWYHSHYSAQYATSQQSEVITNIFRYADGLLGPVRALPPST
jgi:hypothetical protein